MRAWITAHVTAPSSNGASVCIARVAAGWCVGAFFRRLGMGGVLVVKCKSLPGSTFQHGGTTQISTRPGTDSRAPNPRTRSPRWPRTRRCRQCDRTSWRDRSSGNAAFRIPTRSAHSETARKAAMRLRRDMRQGGQPARPRGHQGSGGPKDGATTDTPGWSGHEDALRGDAIVCRSRRERKATDRRAFPRGTDPCHSRRSARLPRGLAWRLHPRGPRAPRLVGN